MPKDETFNEKLLRTMVENDVSVPGMLILALAIGIAIGALGYGATQ